MLSELELGYLAARAPFLCVTGTNGKSTTTHLAGALLRGAGRQAEVCGNIGRALCEVAESVPPTALLVVEVSSFQLETVDRAQAVRRHLAQPDARTTSTGTATSTPTARSKQRLFARQDEADYAVWNADDPEVTGAPRRARRAWLEFSRRARRSRTGPRRGRRASGSAGAAGSRTLMEPARAARCAGRTTC